MNNHKKELLMTRVFDAPVDLVYNAWLDPNLITQWWGPKGVFIPVCEVDPKPGGRIYIVMQASEELGKFKGTQWPMEGQFVKLTKSKEIVFTANAISDGKVILEQQTTVTLTQEKGKTTMKVHVVLTKVLPGSEFAVAGMEQGWNEQLDKLVAFMKKA